MDVHQMKGMIVRLEGPDGHLASTNDSDKPRFSEQNVSLSPRGRPD